MAERERGNVGVVRWSLGTFSERKGGGRISCFDLLRVGRCHLQEDSWRAWWKYDNALNYFSSHFQPSKFV